MKTLSFFLVFTLMFFFAPTHTQAKDSLRPLAVQVTDRISFYELGASGEFEKLTSLPANFGILGISQSEWTVLSASSFVISPDGQQIAFVAYRSEQDAALFLYTLADATLRQKTILGIGAAQWSPNGDAILVRHPDSYTGYSTGLRDAYIYDLASDRLTNITNSPQERQGWFEWLPDNLHIMYAGQGLPCQAPCVSLYDIYLMDRSGNNRIVLTNLGIQASSDSLHTVDTLTWSVFNQRIYYVTGCSSKVEERTCIYSVSRDGDNRLEINSPVLFPDDEYREIVAIKSVLADKAVFVAMQARTQVITGNPNRPLINVNHWRLLRIDGTGDTQVAAEIPFGAAPNWNLAQTVVSPDGKHLALLGFTMTEEGEGKIVVVEADTGEIISDSAFEDTVCEAQWLDNHTLLYALSQDSCYEQNQSAGISLLNIEDGSTDDITAEFAGGTQVWLLPPPRFEITDDADVK